MRGSSHIRLVLIATSVWAGFLVCGLPSYYQQYSTTTMVIFDLVVLVPINGMQFLINFWFRSIYYAIPWVLLPTVALMLDRRSARASTMGGSLDESA